MSHSPCHGYEHRQRNGALDGLQLESALNPGRGSEFLEKTLESVSVDAKETRKPLDPDKSLGHLRHKSSRCRIEELSKRWPDLCNQPTRPRLSPKERVCIYSVSFSAPGSEWVTTSSWMTPDPLYSSQAHRRGMGSRNTSPPHPRSRFAPEKMASSTFEIPIEDAYPPEERLACDSKSEQNNRNFEMSWSAHGDDSRRPIRLGSLLRRVEMLEDRCFWLMGSHRSGVRPSLLWWAFRSPMRSSQLIQSLTRRVNLVTNGGHT